MKKALALLLSLVLLVAFTFTVACKKEEPKKPEAPAVTAPAAPAPAPGAPAAPAKPAEAPKK